MRVSFWPLYSHSGASSRLRVYALHEELLRMGIDSRIAFDPTADVFVLQKHRDPLLIRDAAKAKFLVYDFDDTEELGKFKEHQKRRDEIAYRYWDMGVTTRPEYYDLGRGGSAHHFLPLFFDDRDSVRDRLSRAGIPVGHALPEKQPVSAIQRLPRAFRHGRPMVRGTRTHPASASWFD